MPFMQMFSNKYAIVQIQMLGCSFIYLTLITIVLCELLNASVVLETQPRLFQVPFAEIYQYCFPTKKITVTGLHRQRLISKDL